MGSQYLNIMRSDRGGKKEKRGGSGNHTETHQIARMLRKELPHCVGGYTPDSLKDFKGQFQV